MSPVDPCAYDRVVVAFSGGKLTGRAIDTISAAPSASRASATSGLLIRFEVITGIETSGRSRAVR